MRGRKPQPTQLKVIRGNPGKRPLPEDEPEVDPEIPDPPPHLNEDALEEWRKITVQLYDAGILTGIDRAALASYCQAYGRWAQAERAINRMAENDPNTKSLLVKSAKGNPMSNPLIGVANKAMGDMMKYAIEFGMTPSARSRIKVNEKISRSENPFLALKINDAS